MEKHIRKIDKALDDLYMHLEAQAIKATIKLSLSKRNKDKDCTFVCGMGTYGWNVDGEFFEPPVVRTFGKAFHLYGYSVFTRNIRIVYRNGVLVSKERKWSCLSKGKNSPYSLMG